MRRFKRRISRRDFIAWTQFDRLRPLDSTRKRNELLALQTVFLARQAGNKELEFDDLLRNPFDDEPSSDMNSILQQFQASG